jgi:hypothetical protein
MYKSLIFSLLTTAVVSAGTITVALDPVGGSVTGAPGATVGWGFTLTNSSTSWISVTSSALTFETNPSIGAYTDFIGLQGGPMPSFAVAPSGIWMETFDGLSQGVGSYAISSSAALFAQDSGSILIGYDLFNGDPTVTGMQTGSSSVSTAIAVNVAPGSQTPEPATFGVTAAMLLLLVSARRRMKPR